VDVMPKSQTIFRDFSKRALRLIKSITELGSLLYRSKVADLVFRPRPCTNPEVHPS
jgi:hypothetical protein